MYVREIEELKFSMDPDFEARMVKWRTAKRTEQTQRLLHAALCESWSTYWVYRRTREFNTVIIAFLIVLLIVLWRDNIYRWLYLYC
ncbi:hypothetical protein BDZ94DRAFT_834107 [Collybia nuda]|uniref:Uncharacterized protein n=1 Tax=Collybia nuda TaxID=64659 RepID=A0A9P5YDH3_9AGAR|nr:hypothetical protein BDZ94DRAFT_834107 [Collybia nuda]